MKIFIILVTALLVFSCSDTTDPEEIYLTLKFTPSSQIIQIGENANFTVSIAEAKNIFAFSCEIVFTENIASISEDSFLVGAFWNNEQTISLNVIEEGIYSVAIGLEGTGGIDGNGDLFSFEMSGLEQGSCNLEFQNITLLDDEGISLTDSSEIDVSGGELVVE
jgi:hypothetical protein